MSSVIKNAKQLGTTKLRRDALRILEAGLQAVQIPTVLKKSITLHGETLKISGAEINLSAHKNIYVIGVGKAAFEAGKYLDQLLGDRITRGIVLDVKANKLKHIESIAGTHPLPSQKNITATNKIIKLAKSVKQNDLVLTIVSGGGSALFCKPSDLTCNEMIALTKSLLESGASIDEINTVRKHTSGIQGGRLASILHPAHVIGLIFSDVPGDRINTVASGPTSIDTTTNKDAEAILQKYRILEKCKLKGCGLEETPKSKSNFMHVTNVLLLKNEIAQLAMASQAKQLGYKIKLLKEPITIEAKKAGLKLVRSLSSKTALIGGGETFVKVTGAGRGGRNQETVLSALSKIKAGELVISCASDGIDNSDVAGAITDSQTLRKAKMQKLDIESTIENNDSYNFFKTTKDQIKTGSTGTNVSDLFLGLKS